MRRMRRYSYVDRERSRKMRGFIRALLRKYGIRLEKEKDQHFVVDRVLLRKLSSSVEAPTIYEIGTGFGILTRELAKRSFVYSIDISLEFLKIAKREVLEGYDVELIGGDALKIYPPVGISEIVGNIPYSISGPLIYRLMEDFGRPRAILTVQKEFAEKISSIGSRNTTATSVLVHNLYEPKIIGVFPPESFYPKPKVWSAILLLEPREERCNYRILKKIVKKAFSSPNRKLKNLLDFFVPQDLAHKRPRELSLEERCSLVRGYIDEYGESHGGA